MQLSAATKGETACCGVLHSFPFAPHKQYVLTGKELCGTLFDPARTPPRRRHVCHCACRSSPLCLRFSVVLCPCMLLRSRLYKRSHHSIIPSAFVKEKIEKKTASFHPSADTGGMWHGTANTPIRPPDLRAGRAYRGPAAPPGPEPPGPDPLPGLFNRIRSGASDQMPTLPNRDFGAFSGCRASRHVRQNGT